MKPCTNKVYVRNNTYIIYKDRWDKHTSYTCIYIGHCIQMYNLDVGVCNRDVRGKCIYSTVGKMYRIVTTQKKDIIYTSTRPYTNLNDTHA